MDTLPYLMDFNKFFGFLSWDNLSFLAVVEATLFSRFTTFDVGQLIIWLNYFQLCYYPKCKKNQNT